MVNSLLIATKRCAGITVLAATIAMSGCASPSVNEPAGSTGETSASDTSTTAATDRPQVVATSSVLCDLTRQLAQDTVALTCLLQPNQDPHAYEPTPSDRKALEDADLVVYGGYNYETSLIQMINATTTPAPKVAVFEAAVTNPLLGEAHDHAHEDEAQGDEHNDEHGDSHSDDHGHDDEGSAQENGGEAPDPHVWHNPDHGTAIVTILQDQLQQLSPNDAEQYQQNAEAITAELNQIDQWMTTQVATVPATQRQLVTPHDSFQYFADAYGFTVKGALEGLSTDQRPSAARLAELVETVKEAGVTTIFAEATTNRNLIETVAKDADVTVADQPLYVEGPGGDDTPATTYQLMLVSNTCTVVNALGGRCETESAPVAVKE